MDTELARTFLKIVETGSFVEAAVRLHLTQSTISARVRRLEEQLGTALFERRADGVTLTPAGRQFQRHAVVLVRTVERAQQDIGIAGGFQSIVTVGGRMGLWEGLLSPWLASFMGRFPDIAIRALVGLDEDLMQALIEGRTDVAVMYVPQARPGLVLEKLLEERLVMVATQAVTAPEALAQDYVYVDWGPEFYAWQSRLFPVFSASRVSFSIGAIGLQHVLARGGCGYFPARLVSEAVRAGQLHRVPGTPEFRLPAYLCFSEHDERRDLGGVLNDIRAAAAAIETFDS